MIRLLLAVLASLLVLSCAPKVERLDIEKFVWPQPPEKARIKLVAVIATDLDFRKPSFAEKMFGYEMSFDFLKPHGITVDKRGNIYVSDTGRATVSVINREAGTYGKLFNPMGFALPLGLAYDESMDWVAVADGAGARVVVIDVNKNKLAFALGQKGEFSRPVAVAFDSARQRIYVADAGLHKIKVFDFGGQFLFDIGEKGVAPGKLYFPTGLTVDKDGSLYVVNSFNFRFDRFDADGKFVKSVGEHGDRPGNFARPKDIALDSEGHIYITDAAFNNFQIFDKEGGLYLFVGEGGTPPAAFRNIYSIAIDKNDLIYTVDQNNGRIQIFKYIAGIDNAPAPAIGNTPEAKPFSEAPAPETNGLEIAK